MVDVVLPFHNSTQIDGKLEEAFLSRCQSKLEHQMFEVKPSRRMFEVKPDRRTCQDRS
jgi:hypothetical protein